MVGFIYPITIHQFNILSQQMFYLFQGVIYLCAVHPRQNGPDVARHSDCPVQVVDNSAPESGMKHVMSSANHGIQSSAKSLQSIHRQRCRQLQHGHQWQYSPRLNNCSVGCGVYLNGNKFRYIIFRAEKAKTVSLANTVNLK